MTTTFIRTHRDATPDEIAAMHEHDWHIILTHSLLPAGDGWTYECACGAVREVMCPIPGERSERISVPL